MEEEVKRRFADLNKRTSELSKRVYTAEEEFYREMQSVGVAESGTRGRGAVSQWQLIQDGEMIARGKAHVLKLGNELHRLKEQVAQMQSALVLYVEAGRLWGRVNETTANLTKARDDSPAISLEEAKATAGAANEELLRLRERKEQIIQEEQATKARAPIAAAEALKERIKASQLNVEAALSRGNRNAYLKAQRDVEQLSASSAVKHMGRFPRAFTTYIPTKRQHGALAGASILAAQQASRSGMPSAQLQDIRRQILDAEAWNLALQMRVNKIESVPKLEAELQKLTTQARDLSERAFAADNGSDSNLLKFNGVPERDLLKMPSGGGKRTRKGKTAKRRRYRSKAERI